MFSSSLGLMVDQQAMLKAPFLFGVIFVVVPGV